MRPQRAGDGGDEVKHLREAFHPPQLGHGDAAKLADLAEVVALEIGDHEQLGALFGGGGELAHGGGIAFGIADETRARAFDRTRGDAGTVHAQKQLGRGGEHRRSGQLHEGGMRRGRNGAQF
jgi:hypothetical protein